MLSLPGDVFLVLSPVDTTPVHAPGGAAPAQRCCLPFPRPCLCPCSCPSPCSCPRSWPFSCLCPCTCLGHAAPVPAPGMLPAQGCCLPFPCPQPLLLPLPGDAPCPCLQKARGPSRGRLGLCSVWGWGLVPFLISSAGMPHAQCKGYAQSWGHAQCLSPRLMPSLWQIPLLQQTEPPGPALPGPGATAELSGFEAPLDPAKPLQSGSVLGAVLGTG